MFGILKFVQKKFLEGSPDKSNFKILWAIRIKKYKQTGY